jgi:hypothetical protein
VSTQPTAGGCQDSAGRRERGQTRVILACRGPVPSSRIARMGVRLSGARFRPCPSGQPTRPGPLGMQPRPGRRSTSLGKGCGERGPGLANAQSSPTTRSTKIAPRPPALSLPGGFPSVTPAWGRESGEAIQSRIRSGGWPFSMAGVGPVLRVTNPRRSTCKFWACTLTLLVTLPRGPASGLGRPRAWHMGSGYPSVFDTLPGGPAASQMVWVGRGLPGPPLFPGLGCFRASPVTLPWRLPGPRLLPCLPLLPGPRGYAALRVTVAWRSPEHKSVTAQWRLPGLSGYPARRLPGPTVTRPDGYPAQPLPGPTVTRPRHLPGQGRLPGVGGYPATAVTRPRPLCNPRAFHIRLDTTWALDVGSALVAGLSMLPGRRS